MTYIPCVPEVYAQVGEQLVEVHYYRVDGEKLTPCTVDVAAVQIVPIGSFDRLVIRAEVQHRRMAAAFEAGRITAEAIEKLSRPAESASRKHLASG